ncbi:MAG: type I-D CRISPR-associated protein Cas7/Csc2 [Candidatus Nezhaarchaeota archaeon]|nr:type I-D CRISPR-associated protein Cas7/Csc2 [Candidatus Nezhaarchaeota archaeon]
MPVRLEEIGKKLFEEKYRAIADWTVKRDKPDKYNAIPKGKVANVYVVIEPLSRLIIRHEQETLDVTTVPSYLGFNVPAILNTKVQSGAIRRQMLSLLHEWFNRNKDRAEKELGGLAEIKDYTCVMRPYMRRAPEERKIPEGFEGYCGKCPNCLIFGYAVQEGAGYNVKSRVEGDLYVSPVAEHKALVTVTFNAIDDIAKTTYRPEVGPGPERTGALYQFRMIEAGVPFVGKMALRDMTLAELLLTLMTISRTTRVGGRQTHFGEIRIHIPAILFGKYEVSGGYDIVNKIASEEKVPTPKDVMNEVMKYVREFEGQGILILDEKLGDKLRGLREEESDEIILQAWKDVLIYKRSLDQFVSKG